MEKLDGLTFFGHNKGISDTDPIETVKMWVTAMYYFNLEFDLPYNDLNGFTFYGSLKTNEIEADEIYVKDNVRIVLNSTEVIENTYPIDTDIHFIIKDTLDRIFKWMNTTY